MAKSFRELLVWQRAMELARATYAVASRLPESERYGLSSQLRRAAVSIPSNIAEGHERRSRAEYRRFVAIACGSLAELETQLELVMSMYPQDTASAMKLADETGRMLRAIERGLRNVGISEEAASYRPDGRSCKSSNRAQDAALSPQPSALEPKASPQP